jgi:hypothetical protein
MSVAGVFSSSNLFSVSSQSSQNSIQQFQQDFEQLGQDLQAGNLSAAQQDYATLQQLGPQASSTSSAQSASPIAQAFNQLGQDLQSGNLSAAQQDYANIQQDAQSQTTESHHAHHHHHGGGSSEVTQLFDQLGQSLQSGSLTTAQQDYNSLVQALPQSSQGTSQVAAQELPQSSSISVSVNA